MKYKESLMNGTLGSYIKDTIKEGYIIFASTLNSGDVFYGILISSHVPIGFK